MTLVIIVTAVALVTTMTSVYSVFIKKLSQVRTFKINVLILV